MEISEATIAAAAAECAVFAFDEGTDEEIHAAKARFDSLVGEAYRILARSAVMSKFHRPTAGEFRVEFIRQCLNYLRRQGLA